MRYSSLSILHEGEKVIAPRGKELHSRFRKDLEYGPPRRDLHHQPVPIQGESEDIVKLALLPVFASQRFIRCSIDRDRLAFMWFLISLTERYRNQFVRHGAHWGPIDVAEHGDEETLLRITSYDCDRARDIAAMPCHLAAEQCLYP